MIGTSGWTADPATISVVGAIPIFELPCGRTRQLSKS